MFTCGIPKSLDESRKEVANGCNTKRDTCVDAGKKPRLWILEGNPNLHRVELCTSAVVAFGSLDGQLNFTGIQQPAFLSSHLICEAGQDYCSDNSNEDSRTAFDDEKPPPWLEVHGVLREVFLHRIGDQATKGARKSSCGI